MVGQFPWVVWMELHACRPTHPPTHQSNHTPPKHATTYIHSDNWCICGDVPPWLSQAAWSNAWNTSLGTPCDSAPFECSPVLPLDWYIDNAPLLDLKAQLSGGQGDPYALYSWTQYRPACTSVAATGDCGVCDWADVKCGVVRAADGALLCNWRFVSCRGRRVVGLHLGKKVGVALVSAVGVFEEAMRLRSCTCLTVLSIQVQPPTHQSTHPHGKQGLAFNYLPAALANLTALETLDFDGEPHSDRPTVLGGTLPPALATLTNLTLFGVTGPVTGGVPAGYASGWARLSVFRVAQTALTGTIPPELFVGKPALTRVSIDGAQIGGVVPDTVFGATLLQELWVQGTPVGGAPWFLDARAAGLVNMRSVGFGE